MSEKVAAVEKALTPSQLADQQEFKTFKERPVRSAVVGAMEQAVTGVAPTLAGPPQTPAPAPAAPTPAPVPLPTKRKHHGAEVDDDLIYILQQPRGHGGKSELKFGNWLVTKINKMGLKTELKAEGAIFVRVGTIEESKILFSCHIDSVHSPMETEPQQLAYDAQVQHIFLDKNAQPKPQQGTDPQWQYRRGSSCLGADDGAGVWLMLKMLEAKVPGGYMFHRGEECGCISSAAMARNEAKWLEQWDAAIAFDRPKDFEIITHQGGALCASNTFAKALAEALSADPDDDLKFEISDGGGTTDTRQYRNIIPECINVGVGYYGHHTPNEYLDWGHLNALKNRCIAIDWTKLPVTRDPKAVPPAPAYGGYYGSGRSYGGSNPFPNSRGAGGAAKPATAAPSKAPAPASVPANKFSDMKTTLEVLYNSAKTVEDIEMWFEMDPALTARCVMQALIEGRAAQIQYNMLLSKTLKL